MGLGDFTSSENTDTVKEDEPSGSSSESPPDSGSDVTQEQLKPIDDTDMDFYNHENSSPGIRPMERQGAMSDFTVADLEQTKTGNINIERDTIKYHLPMFALVTHEPEFKQGNRYQLKHDKDAPRASWHNKVVSCTGCHATSLGKLNKEMVMLVSGTTDKQKALEYIDSKFSEDVSGETSVYVSYMLDCMFTRDLAQGGEQFRAGDNIDRIAVTSKVIQPKMLRLAIQEGEDE